MKVNEAELDGTAYFLRRLGVGLSAADTATAAGTARPRDERRRHPAVRLRPGPERWQRPRHGLLTILSSEALADLWSLSLDRVQVCRDCEYRYVGSDCRPWATGSGGALDAKTPRCAYDPYTGTWNAASPPSTSAQS
jgi:hypothetical protein